MRLLASVLVVILATASARVASAAPVIPALANTHSLSTARVGDVLITELRCLACHTRKDAPPAVERVAPDLTEVGSRVAPEYLRKFIASPATAHGGSTMPDLLAGETAEQRDKIADALTHFLVAQSPRKFQRDKITESETVAGKVLFHSVGCVACHSPRDDDGQELTSKNVVELRHLPTKFSRTSLSDFLYQPLRTRPSGRMPDMKLTPTEAKAIASYLLGTTEATTPAFAVDEARVALGKKAFQQFNCVSCHKLGDAAPVKAPTPIELTAANSSRGCLAAMPDKKNPRYQLSEDQLRAIRAALAKEPAPLTDKTALAMTLVTFNCISCHVRDDYGGVTDERNPHFQTTEKNLGDEARIPPPLTLVGAKLQSVALKKMLFDGDSVRPYMFTRMPQFGEPNLRHLPALFAKLDTMKTVEFKMPNPERGNAKERDREKEMRAGGRLLIGDKALNCIACHQFNGKSAAQKGIDLMTVTQRLQPSWYYQYMLNPSAFRPRAVMPTSWPGGMAIMTDVLHGDTHEQLEAIWYYLTLGTSAQDPSGLRPVESLLTVGETVRTYRGRSNIAGFRGIAVGYPEKLNYAFNAETGTLTALWRNGFVRVDRGGQGAGNFNPATRPVTLAQDVSFARLTDDKTPWPLKPVMTKEAPVNPNPLYPKNHGYQFNGYYFGDAEVPTFMYHSGDVSIEDRSTVQSVNGKSALQRQFTFNTPQKQTLWFRALTGKVQAKSKTQFETPDLRLTTPDGPTLLRPLATDKTAFELLLSFELTPGQSTRTLTYELLP